VKTASGATTVQIVHKRGRIVDGIDHIGSARDADQLALLEQVARERLHAGHHVLEFNPPATDRAGTRTAVVEAASDHPSASSPSSITGPWPRATRHRAPPRAPGFRSPIR
jgi:hypothetical protein